VIKKKGEFVGEVVPAREGLRLVEEVVKIFIHRKSERLFQQEKD